jgi:hypothetical protein
VLVVIDGSQARVRGLYQNVRNQDKEKKTRAKYPLWRTRNAPQKIKAVNQKGRKHNIQDCARRRDPWIGSRNETLENIPPSLDTLDSFVTVRRNLSNDMHPPRSTQCASSG